MVLSQVRPAQAAVAEIAKSFGIKSRSGTDDDQAQPGDFGGGRLPSFISDDPDAKVALAMTPPGSNAVAIFPPFVQARSVPAIGVIFREDSGSWTDRIMRSLFGSSGSNKDKYGFRVFLTLVENQPCELGVNCEYQGEPVQLEQFGSDESPECRTVPDPENRCLNYFY